MNQEPGTVREADRNLRPVLPRLRLAGPQSSRSFSCSSRSRALTRSITSCEGRPSRLLRRKASRPPNRTAPTITSAMTNFIMRPSINRNPGRLLVVLDTNVVLDWLLFRLPVLDPLRDALSAGRTVIATHALLFEELTRVLERPQISRYTTEVGAVIDSYRTQTNLLDLEPQLLLHQDSLPNGFPRCRDPDDDKFMAFAWHSKTGVLVTKDRELLKLRKRARAFGITVLTIEEMLRNLPLP